MINYNIIGDTSKLSDILVDDIIKDITSEICKELNITSNHYVSFIIVDNDEIHNINKTYRNVDRPTDVITFANIDSVDSGIPTELGDIFISYEKVYEQALEYNHSSKREFAFLVTHGLLHIFGYDHMEKEDEVEMFSLQDKILNNLKIYR